MSALNSRPDITRRLLLVATWVAIFAAWELAFRVFAWSPNVFPAPSHILAALGRLWAPSATPDGKAVEPLSWSLAMSILRLVIGFAISYVFGLAAGVLLWRFRFLNSLLGPLFLGFQTLPSVCWVPLAVLLMDVSEKGVLFVMIAGSAFSMAIAHRDGLRALPPIYRLAGSMLGATGSRLYLHVLLPASMPALATTLRQGFAFSWRSLLGAEMVLMTKAQGVGYLLSIGKQRADVAHIIAVMFVMVGFSMLVDRFLFAPIEQRVRTRFGLAQAERSNQ